MSYITRLWDFLMVCYLSAAWEQCEATLREGAFSVYCQRHCGHGGKHRTHDGRVWK